MVFPLLQFTYKIDKIQLNFLQLMSNRAEQRITFNCLNSVAFYNQANSTFDQAIKMLTSDENVLTADSESRLAYSVLSDNCQVSVAPQSRSFIRQRSILFHFRKSIACRSNAS